MHLPHGPLMGTILPLVAPIHQAILPNKPEAGILLPPATILLMALPPLVILLPITLRIHPLVEVVMDHIAGVGGIFVDPITSCRDLPGDQE